MSVVGRNAIFPTVVGVCRRKDLIDPIKEAFAKCDDWQGMKSTTNYALQNETKLQKDLVQEIKEYLSHVLHLNQNIKITTSWWTKVNDKNYWDLHYHNHPNSWFSAVFYFEDNCEIDFAREESSISVIPEFCTELTSTVFNMELNAGDLLIFPSGVLHKAKFAGTNRHSLAINFMPVGLVGEGHSECVYG